MKYIPTALYWMYILIFGTLGIIGYTIWNFQIPKKNYYKSINEHFEETRMESWSTLSFHTFLSLLFLVIIGFMVIIIVYPITLLMILVVAVALFISIILID